MSEKRKIKSIKIKEEDMKKRSDKILLMSSKGPRDIIKEILDMGEGIGERTSTDQLTSWHIRKALISNELGSYQKRIDIEDKRNTETNFRLDIIEKLNNIDLTLEKIFCLNEELVDKITNLSGEQKEVEDDFVVEIQDLPEKIIENIIIHYLESHKDQEIFPSDIAFAHNLDAKKVFNVSKRLKKEGKII